MARGYRTAFDRILAHSCRSSYPSIGACPPFPAYRRSRRLGLQTARNSRMQQREVRSSNPLCSTRKPQHDRGQGRARAFGPAYCPNRSRRAPPKIEDPGGHANAVALEQADRLTAPIHRGAINATARRMRVQDAKPRILAEVGHAETDRLVIPSLLKAA